MPPAAPIAAASTNGLAARAPAAPGAGISPNGAPGVPGVAQGTIAPPVQANTAPQFNSAPMMQDIANYYQIPKQTALAQAGVEQNKFNATTAYEGKLQEQSEFAKEQLDPNQYKIIQGPKGVVVLDPVTGQQVSNGQYVSRTGSQGLNNLMDALKTSTNQRDQQFVSDYQNAETYMNAVINAKNSPDARNIVNSYQKSYPQLKNMTPQQFATMFNGEYGDYLGLPQTGQTPSQAQLTPQLSQQDLNYLLEKNIWGTTGGQNFGGYNFGLNPATNTGNVAQSATGGSSIAPPALGG